MVSDAYGRFAFVVEADYGENGTSEFVNIGLTTSALSAQ
jgi:hypothetical protein